MNKLNKKTKTSLYIFLLLLFVYHIISLPLFPNLLDAMSFQKHPSISVPALYGPPPLPQLVAYVI